MKTLIDRIGQTLLLVGFCISAQNLCGGVITDGSIQITGHLPVGTFTLSGSDFTATGNFIFGSWGPAYCLYCSQLSVAGYEVGNDFGHGPATIGATTFTTVNWGTLDAAGPSVFNITGPEIILNNGPGTYVAPFWFTGSLCGTLPGGGIPSPCLANLPQLIGSGLVNVTVIDVAGLGLQETAATYTFYTPEPSSIVLNATAGLIFLLRRRKLNTRLVL